MNDILLQRDFKRCWYVIRFEKKFNFQFHKL